MKKASIFLLLFGVFFLQVGMAYSACPSGEQANYICPFGFTLSSDKSTCYTSPTCPEGSTYVLSRNRCESQPSSGETKCDLGWTYDMSNNVCYVSATCPSGSTLQNGKCETPPTVTCQSPNSGNYSLKGYWCFETANNGDTIVNHKQCYSVSGGQLCPIDMERCTATYTNATCPSGGTLNTTLHKCTAQPHPTCTSGYTYDSSIDRCTAPATCTSGGSLNPYTDKCEIVVTSSLCPSGYTYNTTYEACIKAPTCPSGGTYNPNRDRCEYTVTKSCPSGYTYNSSRDDCEANPQCPSGSSYNATYNTCFFSKLSVCPTGYTEALLTAKTGLINPEIQEDNASVIRAWSPGTGQVGQWISLKTGGISHTKTTYTTEFFGITRILDLSVQISNGEIRIGSGGTWGQWVPLNGSGNSIVAGKYELQVSNGQIRLNTLESGSTTSVQSYGNWIPLYKAKCVAPVQCPQTDGGATYNTSAKSCIANQKPKCEDSNYTLIESAKVCQQYPKCPSYGFYDKSDGQCEVGANNDSDIVQCSRTNDMYQGLCYYNGVLYYSGANSANKININNGSIYVYNSYGLGGTSSVLLQFSNRNVRLEGITYNDSGSVANRYYSNWVSLSTGGSSSLTISYSKLYLSVQDGYMSIYGSIPGIEGDKVNINIPYFNISNSGLVDSSGSYLIFTPSGYAYRATLEKRIGRLFATNYNIQLEIRGKSAPLGVDSILLSFEFYANGNIVLTNIKDESSYSTFWGSQSCSIINQQVTGNPANINDSNHNMFITVYEKCSTYNNSTTTTNYNTYLIDFITNNGEFSISTDVNSKGWEYGNWVRIVNTSCPSPYVYRYYSQCYYNYPSCYGSGRLNTNDGMCEEPILCPTNYSYGSYSVSGWYTTTTYYACISSPLPCPDGGQIQGNQCVLMADKSYCPSGSTYDTGLQECVSNPNCPSGGSLNTSTDKCQISVTNECPSDYTYDSSTNLCYSSPICNYGYYDASINYCRLSAASVCPSGYIFDNSTDKCLMPPQCASPGSYSDTLNKCGALPNYNCPASYSYNSADKLCEANPQCPSGDNFDSSNNKCYKGNFTCPYGSGHACLPYNGVNYCSPYDCVNMSTTQGTTQEANLKSYTNDGKHDANGNCLGQIYIFNGKGYECRTAGVKTMFTNCCSKAYKKQGKILFVLPQCNKTDAKTDQFVQSGVCHYVGEYCSWKLKFPKVCLQHKKVYCCFHSKLGRIIQEQGRPQLKDFGYSGDWGSPTNPNCRGFTPDEFQMLDFNKMDLSSYFGDIAKKVAGKQKEIEQKAQQNISNFYNQTR